MWPGQHEEITSSSSLDGPREAKSTSIARKIIIRSNACRINSIVSIEQCSVARRVEFY